MLIFERTCGKNRNGIVIKLPDGNVLTIQVSWISKNRCKLRFSDSEGCSVYREEVHKRIKEEKKNLDTQIIED